MGAATQLTDFSDLYTDLQNRVRVQTGVTATENQAKRYINIALHDVHIGHGEKFPWAERKGVLVTQQRYTTGTVTISQGSASLTGSSTAWNTSNDFSVANARVGGKIVIAGGEEVYEVSAVGGDTSITLTSKYTQDDASGDTYEYFEDEYALASDFLRPIDAQFFDDRCNIEIVGRREFRQRFPRNKITGKPRIATLIDKGFSGSTTRQRRIVFHKPPDEFYTIPYHYVTSNLAVTSSGTEQTQLSSDDDEPIIPLRYRHVLVLHALHHWYRDKKNDTRSQEARAEYLSLLDRMTSDTEIGATHPALQPRVGPYKRAARRPYRAQRGRYSTGSRFDEVR